jgi:crotonobetainyl-CoA:carnitine CoA-transferase CaiB-like acyl-CoA transferase
MTAPVSAPDAAAGESALRVLEIAGRPGAAYAARFLRHLGAQVTKARIAGLWSETFDELDAGKRVLSFDPADAASMAALQEAIADADVVVRACDAPEAGAGPIGLQKLRAAHPGLITVAITPFGETGPQRNWTGTDLTAIHAGGLGYGTPPRVTDPNGEYPLGIPGDPVAPLTGIVAVLGVLHTLHERDRSGEGRHVEVSAQDAVVSLMFNNIAGVVEGGPSPGRLASDRPGARRQFLPAADGLLVQMAGRPHHQRAWLELLGPAGVELARRLEDGAKPADLASEIAAVSDTWTSRRARRQATDEAQAAHIPVEPVLAPSEVLDCPQLRARGFWERLPDGTLVAGHPFGPVADGDGPRRLPRRVRSGTAGGDRGPLAGIKVIDFTWVFAGPIATRILAALGADVLKVEAPGAPDGPARPFLTRSLQGGKRSAKLDLRDAASRAMVERLVAEADVVVENFSTGVMERYGLGWHQASASNPRLVMLSISGMGRTGPYSHHVMLGQLAQAYSGLTAITGYEGGPPRGIEDGGFWSDPVTGYSGAAAVLAALREREVTGRGRRIDVSLVEATVATLLRPLLAARRGDDWSTRGNFHPAMAPHDVYRSAPLDQDRWVALACRDDSEWRALCAVLGRPDLLADPALSTLEGRQGQRPRLRTEIEKWTRQRSAEAAATALQAAGVPAAPCANTAGVVGDAHLNARAMFVREAAGAAPVAMRLPWDLAPAAPVFYGPASESGADTDAVLTAAGRPP